MLATIVVTSLADDTLANLAGDGEVSLREAIEAANTNASVDGSTAGNDRDTITFAAGLTGTIALTQGSMRIDEHLIIEGPGHSQLTIDAQNSSRILWTSAGRDIDFALRGITLANGNSKNEVNSPNTTPAGLPTRGGSIFFYSRGNMTLDNVVITGSKSPDDGGAIMHWGEGDLTINNSRITGSTSGDNGGAIYSRGKEDDGSNPTVTITDSTISGNTAEDKGGGIAASLSNISIVRSTISGNRTTRQNGTNGGGGVYARYGTVTVSASAISDNTSAQNGGGIKTQDSASSLFVTNSTIANNTAVDTGGGLHINGAATLTQSTISGNSVEQRGGGIYLHPGTSGTINNTIVAGNFTSNTAADVQGSLNGSHNLVGQNLTFVSGSDNLVNVDWKTVLENHEVAGVTVPFLKNNGGLTETIALRAGSVATPNPAIDVGDITLAKDAAGNALSSDQRGLPFARVSGSTVDMGAYEFQTLAASSFVVTTLNDELDYGNATVSLREAINSANGNIGNEEITFADRLTGTITLSLGQLEIFDGSTITGPGQSQLAIDAKQASRVLNIEGDSIDVILSGLTITGGRTRGDNKILGDFEENLGVETIHSGGGIRFLSNGTLTVASSTLSGNSTAGQIAPGGGIFTRSGNVTLTSSTVSGNSTTGDLGYGGGVFTRSGNVTLAGSTLSGNSTAGGFAFGGGIFTESGSVTLTGSTLTGNNTKSSSVDGGARGGGIDTSSGSVTLIGSTLSGNSTSFGSGGGINTGSGSVTLIGSTVSGNSTTGLLGYGGGISTHSGSLTLTNSTVSGNSSSAAGGGFWMHPNYSDDKVTIHNSIIAGNTDNGTAPDFLAPRGGTNQLDVKNSLIGDTAGTSLSEMTNGNQLNVDWKTVLESHEVAGVILPLLKNNGGPTQTIALLASSPAIDQGNNALALGPGGNNLANDQRGTGFQRVLDGDGNGTATVDMGAFEFPAATGGAIQLPAGETTVTNESGTIFVRNNGNILFQAARKNVTALSFLGGSGDASLAVGDLQLLAGAAVTFDGQGGNNRFRLLEQSQTLDLITLPDDKLQNIATIDITGSGDNTLTLNLNEVVNLSSTTDTLRVQHGVGDVVNYGAGWTVEFPQIIAGQFVHVLKQAGATIEVANTLPFQNPLRPLDTNRDGTVTPLDVLVIINRLNATGSSSLQTPTFVAGLTEYFYIDTSGDGSVAPIDVIQVINFLNNPTGQPEGESRIETTLLAATVQPQVLPSARISRSDATNRLRRAEWHTGETQDSSVLRTSHTRPTRVIEHADLPDSIEAFFASFLRIERGLIL